MLALAASEARREERGEELVLKVSSESAIRILSDPENRRVLSETVAAFCSKRLTVEESRQIDENKIIPYLTGMFGDSLEIK